MFASSLWKGPALLPLTLALAASAAPGHAAQMRMFVTSTSCDGNLGPCSAAVGDSGLAAANNICQERATAAGLDTEGQVFRAWISDATADAFCNVLGLAGQRFGAPPCGVAELPAAGPWTRRDGTPFGATLTDLLTIGPISSAAFDEDGLRLPYSYFHSGTNTDGTLLAGSNCDGWTSGSEGVEAGGVTDFIGEGWASGAAVTCGYGGRLVCLEVGAGDPLAYPSLPGALVFVSSIFVAGDTATWPGSGGVSGLAGADAACQALAAAAFLPFPGSFVAYLSDGATDAPDRLNSHGRWERVDGVVIAFSRADLIDGSIADPIAFDQRGERVTDLYDAWTGTDEWGSATGLDCADWTSSDPLDSGTTGKTWRCDHFWTGASPTPCDQAHPHLFFCFSNQILLGWDSFESGDFYHWPVRVGQQP